MATRQAPAEAFDLTRLTRRLLAQQFGPEWVALRPEQQQAVLADFAGLLYDEYDTPDDTMPDSIAQENVETAARVYRDRIGAGNLAAYVACLMVKPKTT